MKVSRIFNENLEERAADLRAKLVIPFLASVALAIVLWFFKKACTIRTGVCWYALWNFLYHISRAAAVVMLITIVVLLIYVVICTLYEYFGSPWGGRAFASQKRGPKKDKDGSDDDGLDMGDLSMFE